MTTAAAAIDPNNPVVQLCADGMRAESECRIDDARALFLEAWGARRDDYEACIAAHYVARHQPDAGATLLWNTRAVQHAAMASPSQVKSFNASLYLNLADSLLVTGDVTQSERFATLATAALADVADGPYKDYTRRAIEALHERLSEKMP